MELIRRNINTPISVDAVLGTPLNNAYHAENEYDPLAQAVEHVTFNHGVLGSSPRWVTKIYSLSSTVLRARLISAYTKFNSLGEYQQSVLVS